MPLVLARPTLRLHAPIRRGRHPHPHPHLGHPAPPGPTGPPSFRPSRRPVQHRHYQIQPRTLVRFRWDWSLPRSGGDQPTAIVEPFRETEDDVLLRDLFPRMGPRAGDPYRGGVHHVVDRLAGEQVDLLPACCTQEGDATECIRSDQLQG